MARAFLSMLGRRKAAFLGALAVFLAAAGVAAALRGPRLHEAEAILTLREERRLVRASELAAALEGEPPAFDAADLRRLGERLTASMKQGVSLRIEPAGERRYRIRAAAPSAESALQAVQALSRMAREEARARAAEALDRAKEAVERRRREVRGRIETAEDAQAVEEGPARERARRRQILEASLAEIEREIEGIRSRQDKLLLRAQELEAAEHRLREALPTGPEEDGLTSPVLERLRSEIDSIHAQIALKRLSRSPDSPEYRQLAARLAELEEEKRAELYRVRARTIVALRQEASDLDLALRRLDERRLRRMLELRDLEDEERRAEPRRAELEHLRARLTAAEDLVRRIETARAAREGVQVSVEHETAETRGRGGAAGILLWAIPASLAGAVGVGFLADRFDRRVRTDADVKRYLNLPGLAQIPPAGQPLVLGLHPKDPLSEIYSAAAAVLRGYLAEREFRTVGVTSARPGEGKTTVAANLAVALARKGLSVALVDADLRSPRLHEIFGIDNSQGLSTYLLGADEPNFFMAATDVATLFLLPSGPTEDLPGELLESSRMVDLLRALRERYDVVLCDGPPVRGAGEAVTLARLVDTNVWVVRSGLSDRRALGWTRHLLRNVRADVAGVALTFARVGEGERYSVYPASPARV
ncbi:MAG TPA: polysaccharide biosynthesis tyrosine autokinase [Planctomycetota bacterium]|jgi:capsular exopolysaccharide synthesis family protein|nr:polysaccharide biosynthesis tyrosine autokinase [Planctomycetota bacterium]